MSSLHPRKLPRQSRSKATVEAILDACADTVARRGYAALTTHAIASRAGVSVGTLYQYFPNRDAVAGALVVRAMERLLAGMRGALDECVARRLGEIDGTEHLLLAGLRVLVDERPAFARLAPAAPHLFQAPRVTQLQAELMHLPQEIRVLSGERLALPMPEADAWLIGHMVSASMLQISLLEGPPEQRTALTRELARLICRMSLEAPQERDARKASAA